MPSAPLVHALLSDPCPFIYMVPSEAAVLSRDPATLGSDGLPVVWANELLPEICRLEWNRPPLAGRGLPRVVAVGAGYLAGRGRAGWRLEAGRVP